MKPKCFFRGCDHKMKTSIAKKETYGDYPMETSIANWHMVTIIRKPASQKETSPLDCCAINSLPHKSFRFCSPMRNEWRLLYGNHIMILPCDSTL